MAASGSYPALRELPRDQRRELTAELLLRASRTADPAVRERLLHRVILENVCLARSLASRYRSRGIAMDDLEQVASAALVRAVKCFDVSCGGNFLAYAVPSIRGELRRHFRDHGWMVRPPRRIQELQPLVLEERSRLMANNGGQWPSVAEIAVAVGVAEKDVREALCADGCFTPTSLDTPVSEDLGTSLGDLLPGCSTDRDINAAEARIMLWPLIRRLSKRDRKLVRMRFFDELTQQEIADEFGVTQTQVSRLLSRIIRDLQQGLGDDDQHVSPP